MRWVLTAAFSVCVIILGTMVKLASPVHFSRIFEVKGSPCPRAVSSAVGAASHAAAAAAVGSSP